jgi:chromosome condensin MukBEF complex kleisin-like MukF subunit
MAQYAEILERDASGNPPELQARLDAAHEKVQAKMREIREAQSRGDAGCAPFRPTLISRIAYSL